MNIPNTLKKITPFLLMIGVLFLLCYVTNYFIGEGLGFWTYIGGTVLVVIGLVVNDTGKRWPAWATAADFFSIGVTLLSLWLLIGSAMQSYTTWRAEKAREEADLHRIVTTQEINDAIKECPGIKADIISQKEPIQNYRLISLTNTCVYKERAKLQGAKDRAELAEQLKGVK